MIALTPRCVKLPGVQSQLVAYRFSEKSFRRFESDLAAVVKNWPRATIVSPSISPETYMARIRDSVKALFRNEWSVAFDRVELERIWSASVVAGLPDGTVRIGKRAQRKSSVSSGLAVEPFGESKFLIELTDPSAETLRALLEVYQNGYVNGPSRVKGVPMETMKRICQEYNGVSVSGNSETMVYEMF